MAAPACQTGPHFKSGLDHIFYNNPEVHPNRYVWVETPIYNACHISYKVTDGTANSPEAHVEVTEDFDQLHTAWIQAFRPAIKGVYSENPNIPYACVSRSKRKAADRKAARQFDLDNATDDLDGDDRDENERIVAGITAYFAQTQDCTGPRHRTDIEEDARARRNSSRFRRERSDDDARSTRSSASRSKVAGETGSVSSFSTSRTENTIAPGRQKYYAFFIAGWVYSLVQKIVWRMATTLIDEMVNLMMKVYHDLTLSTAKKVGLKELTEDIPDVGSEEEEIAFLVDQSSRAGEAWLPLCFSHTQHPSQAIDMCAADWNAPNYTITLNPLTKFVKRANKNTAVVKSDNTPLQDRDVRVRFVGLMISLAPKEHKWLNENMHDIVCIRHQLRQFSTSNGSVPSTMNIKWTGPTVSLHFIIQRQACIDDCDIFNTWGLFGGEALESMAITCAGRVYQPRMSGKYWRLVQTFEKCTATPSNCTYHFGVALDMFTEKPQTSINGIRYNKMEAEIKLQPGLDREPLMCTWLRRSLFLTRYDEGVVIPFFHIK